MEKETALDNPLPCRVNIREVIEIAKFKINSAKKKEQENRRVIVDKLNLNDYILLVELYNERKDELFNLYLNDKIKRVLSKELGKAKIELLKLIIEDDLKNQNNFQFVKRY